jgi:hypothetical protein
MSAAEDCGRPKSCKMCGMALRVSNSRWEVLDRLDESENAAVLSSAMCIVSGAFCGDAADRVVGAGTGILSMFDGA